MGKGKGPAKADFIENIINISEQYFPIDPEVYQAMSPFIDDVSEIIPDVLVDSSATGGGEGVATSLASDDFDIGDMASSQPSLDSVAPAPLPLLLPAEAQG